MMITAKRRTNVPLNPQATANCAGPDRIEDWTVRHSMPAVEHAKPKLNDFRMCCNRMLFLGLLIFCSFLICFPKTGIAWNAPSLNRNADSPLQEDGQIFRTAHSSNTTGLALTEQERAWLQGHPVIRVFQDPAWPPVEFNDEQGNPSGMSGEYLRFIEKRLGITFQIVRGLTWQEAYERLKRWEIDMTTCVAVTREREEFWTFTTPYLRIPIVIFAQSDVTYISRMQELAGKRVAIVDGYAVSDWIPRDFPDIRLVKVRNAREGLELLQRGNVFAYIDNMLVVSYYLAKLKMMNVKVAGETPYINSQAMAVRKDWPVLAEILQKALDSISETERTEIYRKWVPIRYEYGFNYRLLWQILAAFTAILFGMLIWIRKLSREIKNRKEAEAALSKSEERFRQFFDKAPVPMCFINGEGTMANMNHRFVQTFGYNKEEIPTLHAWWFLSCPDPIERERASLAWETAVRQAMEQKADIGRTEQRVTCKNGVIRTVEMSGIVLGDNVLAILLDFTDRKEAETKIREQLQELQRWHEATLGREDRILDLKREINDLLLQLDKPIRYTSAVDDPAAGNLDRNGRR